MPHTGQKVLMHSRGSYYPYAWCGVVVSVNTPDSYDISHVAQIPHTLGGGSSTWLKIADGDAAARRAMRVRVAPDKEKVLTVNDVCYCREWTGELPTQDQN